MKSFRLLGLAAVILGLLDLPAAAWVYNNHNVPRLGPWPGSGSIFRPPHNRYWCSDNRQDRRGDRRGDRRNDRRRDRRDCRNDDGYSNDSGYYGGGGGGYGPWGYYPYGPYGPDYRVDYSVNTPSRQSTSPYQIALNDGVHLSPLDSGYPGLLPAVGGWANPYATPVPFPAPGMAGPAPAPVASGPEVDVVVGVQRELRRLGYYNGMVNGISDIKTRSAIRAYEASMGLPVTGVMGSGLVRALGIF